MTNSTQDTEEPQEERATFRNEVLYLLRYLPPKTRGEGAIVAAMVSDDMTLERWFEEHPNLFDQPGFYTVATATGETLTIKAKAQQ